jgi:hypothetical protein
MDPRIEVHIINPFRLEGLDSVGVGCMIEIRPVGDSAQQIPYSNPAHYSFFAFIPLDIYLKAIQGARLVGTSQSRARDLRIKLASPEIVLINEHTVIQKGVNLFDLYTSSELNARPAHIRLRASDSFSTVKRKSTIILSDTLYVFDAEQKNPISSYSVSCFLRADTFNNAVAYLRDEFDPARREHVCSPRLIGSMLLSFLQIYELEQSGLLDANQIDELLGYAGLPKGRAVNDFRLFGAKASVVAQFVRVYSSFLRIINSIFDNSVLKITPLSRDRTKIAKLVNSTRDYMQLSSMFTELNLIQGDNLQEFFKDFVEKSVGISYSSTTIQRFLDAILETTSGCLLDIIMQINKVCVEIMDGVDDNRVNLLTSFSKLYEKATEILPLSYIGELELPNELRDEIEAMMRVRQLQNRVQAAATYLGYLNLLKLKAQEKIAGKKDTIEWLNQRIQENNNLLLLSDRDLMTHFNLLNVNLVNEKRNELRSQIADNALTITEKTNELPFYENLISIYDSILNRENPITSQNSYFRNQANRLAADRKQVRLPPPFTLAFNYLTMPLLMADDKKIIENYALTVMPFISEFGDNYYKEILDNNMDI